MKRPATILTEIRDVTERAALMSGPDLIAEAVKHASSQANLARLSGVTANTISTIKSGQEPSLATRNAILWGIARALGL